MSRYPAFARLLRLLVQVLGQVSPLLRPGTPRAKGLRVRPADLVLLVAVVVSVLLLVEC